jgi:hypothetical protein
MATPGSTTRLRAVSAPTKAILGRCLAGTFRGTDVLETIVGYTSRNAKTDLARGGQAGDLQGISGVEEVDSESVRELIEEGQAFEAEVIDGVENAPEPDVAEITTREVPEDDVPSEYLGDGR